MSRQNNLPENQKNIFDSAPSCDDSHTVLNCMPKYPAVRMPSLSAYFPSVLLLLRLPHPQNYSLNTQPLSLCFLNITTVSIPCQHTGIFSYNVSIKSLNAVEDLSNPLLNTGDGNISDSYNRRNNGVVVLLLLF